jgi:Flp pilus assembly pilin Flp
MRLRDLYPTLRAFVHEQEGQTMAEYGVVLAVVALGVFAAIGLLAVSLNDQFEAIAKFLTP